MSGGHFDIYAYRLNDVAFEIQELIDSQKCEYSKEALEEFKKAVIALSCAAVYLQRIDYLVSGDDSEESFHERLQDDLSKIQSSEPT